MGSATSDLGDCGWGRNASKDEGGPIIDPVCCRRDPPLLSGAAKDQVPVLFETAKVLRDRDLAIKMFRVPVQVPPLPPVHRKQGR